jgi:hypothetical protein
MNNAIQANINQFFKGFTNTKQGGTEDPTYIGFRFVFNFTPTARNPQTMQTDESLFSENANLESAQRYLTAIGMPQNAAYLKQFKTLLQYINTNTPWFFQSVSGLQDLWKIEFGENYNPYRAKDKVIEITCLESIDMRMTALADLYRKATFDSKFMRQLLPDNLRWFSIRVQLAEMRSFHQIQNAMSTPISTSLYNTNANTSVLGSSIANTNGSNSITNKSDAYSINEPQLEVIDGLISVLEFHLNHCEFNFWESFPTDKDVAMNGEINMATQKFKINVGHIQEQNNYTIQQIITKDGVTQNNQSNNAQNIQKFDKAFNNVPDNILTSTISGVTGSLQSRLNQIAGLPANLVARGVNSVSAAVTGAVLGNVYSLRNQSTQTIVNSFLGQNQQISGPAAIPGGSVYPPVASAAPVSTLGDVYPPASASTPSTSLGNVYQ